MDDDKRVIWIIYRRRDRPDVARYIFQRPQEDFERDCEVASIDDIGAGVDFFTCIRDAMRRCLALIVVVGPDWLRSEYDDGTRLVDNPNDSVVFEIRSALEQNVPVIPTLVDGAKLPSPQQLPEAIRMLVGFNGFVLRSDAGLRDSVSTLETFLERTMSVRANRTIRRKPTWAQTPTTDNRLFINYRRNNSSEIAQRIYARLRNKFGTDRLFMDIDSITRGYDFRDTLDECLTQCLAMISLIGPRWLDCRDDNGLRRLDDPRDFVRKEIAAALPRNIPIFSVLFGLTQMPRVDELPLDIQSLCYRQALVVTVETFDRDINVLETDVENITKSTSAQRGKVRLATSLRRLANRLMGFK